MPSVWQTYKGLQIPSAPTGDAGVNLKENFEILADRLIPDDATLGGIAFVSGTISEPGLTEDSVNFFWDNTNHRLGIGTDTPAAKLQVNNSDSGVKVGVFKAAASQSVNILEWQNSAGTAVSFIRKDGSLKPAALTNAAAANDSIYYSTTNNKLVYKDPAGTVRSLY